MTSLPKKEIKLEDLLNEMKHIDSDGKRFVTKAFNFAQKAHEGQFRQSGDPYFSHVFETARILAEIKMGPNVIASGLLHDVLEDTDTDPEEIRREFGDDVLFLIQGVTKLGKLKYRGLKRHTESLRKFFIATSKDVRVLIIRLADRLHNMETLEYLPREKQIRKSTEVLEIFAPLAYRLGMRFIHKKLEDTAFSYIQPEEYEKTKQLLRQRKKADMKFLEKFDRSLKKALAKEGMTKFSTSFRIKGLYSLYKKLKRKEDGVEKIHDITALRIVTNSVADCYKVLGIIHSIWKPLPGRLKDYIALPKPNGYQSIHTTIFTGDGGIIEIQIRTQEMHDTAEMGIASHISYKERKVSGEILSQIIWFKNILSRSTGQNTDIDRRKTRRDSTPDWIKNLGEESEVKKDGQQLIEDLKKDFFGHRVFVFTPSGDVIDLPFEASPIDFAYAIHSYIGNHLTGAKINGKLASLDTRLKNGDIVEIVTKKTAGPTRKWLDLVKTSEAKRNIRAKLKLDQ
ncbi:hypothetical protein A2996_01050 [Candidatus Campbellbacteria bacterium RIFCSPLOWO2_01_FULL_34_15]|uniref:TGS domain-containing protein n=2 Tax=Candidatus Campbelliibacteriota TaxID=1752727 RepID=A0A1F5ENR5_9BACT|nr:MAG: hypothetical protein A2811_01365 [Candidatus Campbellbacteria bacterium RIFCSPHIGHO2_01_FULL_34_10]OGD68960.1 MAG: hypothetical protein A2996_01050 [Candidatus Campbellbacteria bacterium RIFCSPLOWO2_01_FULL_34_15]